MKLQTLKPRITTVPGRLQMAATLSTQRSKRRAGRWLMEFKAQHLRAHPLCVECSTPQRPVPAVEVDHRVALVNGGKDFYEDPDQAQSLCSACHKVKTAKDLGHRQKPRIGLDGWPEQERK